MNIGNPNEFTILELAEKIIKLTGSSSKLEFKTLPEDDPLQRKPDISLAQENIDWNPNVQIEEGLEKTIRYFQSL
jgi:UDP-glucuronate decarboxylase